ncbi:retrovirus-related Pol polyprotein from transposon 412, partial [Trichonephila clavipes]
MRKDIKIMVRSCVKCQRAKVTRHTKSPIGTFALPDARFAHIHLDFIGPLPPSNGNQFCMTIIDRFTRWPEVIPTPDMTAETTTRALMHGWISRFGCPTTITTDRGTNFESNLFRELTRMLRCNRIHSTSYHSQANGIIERLHRHLKGALKAHNHIQWTELLPIVLLGMRSALKDDINATCAQLVYGTTLRLPSDLVTSDSINQTANSTYVTSLIQTMRSLNPVSTAQHGTQNIYINPSLKTCSHIFLRYDKVNPPLTPPYTGPHLVISRNDKNFIIDLNGKQSTVSIDRIKPAYLLADVTDHSDLVQTQTIIEKPVTAAPNPSIPYTTRYGRKWIPSHVGIEGNERADFLARTAAVEGVSPRGNLTFSEISTISKLELNRQIKTPPSHAWYFVKSQGESFRLSSRPLQSTYSRFWMDGMWGFMAQEPNLAIL